jgi:hypothetical protein
MSWFAAIWRELIGLFIDDGSLAVLALLWQAVCGLVLPRLGVADGWRAGLLFLGFVAILAESALRGARNKRKSS